MSRDGQRLLNCWYTGGGMYLVGLFDVDKEAGTFQQVPAGINGAPGMNGVRGYGAVVAAGRWWSVGNTLFPMELSAAVRMFAGSPVAIHPVLDLAASLQEGQLSLQTFSAAENLKTIDLPDAPATEGTAADEDQPSPQNTFVACRAAAQPPATAATETVQYDLAGQRVFCGLATKGYVVGLDKLGVKIPKRLELVVPSRMTAGAGQTTRCRWRPMLPRAPCNRTSPWTHHPPSPRSKAATWYWPPRWSNLARTR